MGWFERFHRTLKDALRSAVKASSSWSRSLPWVMLGIRNVPKLDTATSTVEVVYGVPLRIPGACFQGNPAEGQSKIEQLKLAQTNVSDFTPKTLDLGKFRASPFISKSLLTSKFVYVRDDRLGKSSLAPRYVGPFKVLERNWENNNFLLDLGKKKDYIALTRLKVAATPGGSNVRTLLGGVLHQQI